MHVFGLARSEFFCFDSVTVHLQFRLPLQSVFYDAIRHFRQHRKLYPSKIHRNIFYIAIEKQGTQSAYECNHIGSVHCEIDLVAVKGAVHKARNNELIHMMIHSRLRYGKFV